MSFLKTLFFVIISLILGYIPFYAISIVLIIFLRATHLRGPLEPIGDNTAMYVVYFFSIFLAYLFLKNFHVIQKKVILHLNKKFS